MKKVNADQSARIIGGGPWCDIGSGALVGWGLGAVILGAASGGVAIALAGAAASLYCAGNRTV